VESAGPGAHTDLQRSGLLLEHFQRQFHLYCNKINLSMLYFIKALHKRLKVLWQKNITA
jgi:hypothetical protein